MATLHGPMLLKVREGFRIRRRISVLHLVIIHRGHRDVYASGALGNFMGFVGCLAPLLPMLQRAIPEQAQTNMENICATISVTVICSLSGLHYLQHAVAEQPLPWMHIPELLAIFFQRVVGMVGERLPQPLVEIVKRCGI